MSTFQTLTILPDVGSRRFTTVALGSSAVEKIRDEMARLLAVVAVVCQTDASTLTLEQVAALDLVKVRETRDELRSHLVGIDALLINALAVCDGEAALRVCGARELIADAVKLLPAP